MELLLPPGLEAEAAVRGARGVAAEAKARRPPCTTCGPGTCIATLILSCWLHGAHVAVGLRGA